MARNHYGANNRLMEIGSEGFRILEDSYGKKITSQQQQQQQPQQYGNHLNNLPHHYDQKKPYGNYINNLPPHHDQKKPYGNYLSNLSPLHDEKPYYTSTKTTYSKYTSVTVPLPPTTITEQAGVIDCNEAAKLYGGVVFRETGRKKRSFFGFGFTKAYNK
ncbi:hypothetical protein M9H77_36851 [Catharanthus roseus]|uniref:Uncharacterized protein n=1 Tax=Catharanthus roseus TaxID=4058 RepID=A0ACB9ZVK0_CATRO|nr:hypothetical protein M9H77_36851 [Catharanthus roseus]